MVFLLVNKHMKETHDIGLHNSTNYRCLLPKKEPPNENCKNILLSNVVHGVEDRLTMKADENMKTQAWGFVSSSSSSILGAR